MARPFSTQIWESDAQEHHIRVPKGLRPVVRLPKAMNWQRDIPVFAPLRPLDQMAERLVPAMARNYAVVESALAPFRASTLPCSLAALLGLNYVLPARPVLRPPRS